MRLRASTDGPPTLTEQNFDHVDSPLVFLSQCQMAAPPSRGRSASSGSRVRSLSVSPRMTGTSADSNDEQRASGVGVCWTTKVRKHGASTSVQFDSVVIDISPGHGRDVVGSCTARAVHHQPQRDVLQLRKACFATARSCR